MGLWSSGYDVAFTRRRPPVQIRISPSDNITIINLLPKNLLELFHSDNYQFLYLFPSDM